MAFTDMLRLRLTLAQYISLIHLQLHRCSGILYFSHLRLNWGRQPITPYWITKVWDSLLRSLQTAIFKYRIFLKLSSVLNCCWKYTILLWEAILYLTYPKGQIKVLWKISNLRAHDFGNITLLFYCNCVYMPTYISNCCMGVGACPE